MSERMEDLPLFSHSEESDRDSPAAPGRLAPNASLSAAIKTWGEVLEDEGKSIHTIKAFTGDLRLLAKYIGGGMAINTIGTHDLKNFLDWMLNQRNVPCSPKTYARRVTSLKAFFRWLNEAEILSEDPAKEVPQQTVVSPLPTVLTPGEMDRVLAAARAYRQAEDPDARPYTLVSLLLETAIKKGECLRIHLNHIDLEHMDGPLLFVRYGKVSKRYKERKIPLSADWVESFKEYERQYDPENKLFPWSPRRLEYLLEEIGEAAELGEKHLSFDMCRWSAALADYRAGMEDDKIRQKLGISKIQWREVGKKLGRLAEQQEKA
ncbi:MAG: tyrosine-type recombinase/integrase, partial [Anaerolineales bacterium]